MDGQGGANPYWPLGSRQRRAESIETVGEEAAAAFGRDPIPAEYEATVRLPFAEAVLRESMRLKSVAPLLGAATTSIPTAG
jgi:hypothetical protein